MSRQTRNRITLILLAAGFVAAIVIYLTAPVPVTDPLLGDPIDSKNYVRELRLYGGKANVLSAEFQDWFADLWHGQTLAYTVASLSLALALIFRFFTPQIRVEPPSSSAPNPSRITSKPCDPEDESDPGKVSP